MLGTNDAKVENWQGKDCGGPEAFLAGYRQILSGLVEHGEAPTVLVMLPPNIVKEQFGNNLVFLASFCWKFAILSNQWRST
mmetsp:Transcript_27390/g.41463  ORF Transcript_27390/g.41463 Transcript_27390/m.41463 type:complete len:81 (-) Transcript_27390:263-505(-)